MTSRISHTSVDSRDAFAQSRWWGEVLGFAEDPADPNEPGHEECMIFSPDGRTRLLFIEVPEGKAVKNRLHLDLRPDRRHPRGGGRAAAGARARPWSATTAVPTAAAGSRWPTPRATSSACSAASPRTADPYAHLVTDGKRFPA